MRIAFASCVFTARYPEQPVWDWIAAQNPDHLVLLGDSTYFDIDTLMHPRDMPDWAFAQHVHRRYTELIAQPRFVALVGAMQQGRVHAIWDDHDFLWDGATGGDLDMRRTHGGKMRLATAFLEAFRAALQQRLAADSFPANANDPVLWDMDQLPLDTPSLELEPDLWLHLSDGRTHRTRTFLVAESDRTMFGADQKAAFAQAITNAPQAVHLWASGSTMAGYQRYTLDIQWLMGLASQQRMLMLSGDIHRNTTDVFLNANGFPLHEATSSGAAVKDAVVVGDMQKNFGILDVGPLQVDISLYGDNQQQGATISIDRQTWSK